MARGHAILFYKGILPKIQRIFGDKAVFVITFYNMLESVSLSPRITTFLLPNHERDITWSWIKEALPTITEAKAVYDLLNIMVKPSLCTLSKLDMVMPGYEDVHKVFKRELFMLSSEVKK